MRYLLLALFAVSAQSSSFPLYSWVPQGSSQVNLCWSPVADASHYELNVGDSFLGTYVFANSLADTEAVRFRPDLPGREYLYLIALNTNNEVIAISDTIGCYYLSRVDLPQGNQRGMPFALGKLEFRNLVGDSGCIYTDVITSRPSDILGPQGHEGSWIGGDGVSRQDNGTFALKSIPFGHWMGSLEDNAGMTLGRAYYFWSIQQFGNTPIITGRARSDYSPTGTISITGGSTTASTPVGFLVLDINHVASMGLETSGFRRGTFSSGDKVVEQITGRSAYIMTNGQWRGSLDYCCPEIPYYIMNRPHDNGTWTYYLQSVGQP